MHDEWLFRKSGAEKCIQPIVQVDYVEFPGRPQIFHNPRRSPKEASFAIPRTPSDKLAIHAHLRQHWFERFDDESDVVDE
jgi:hypothetical protein